MKESATSGASVEKTKAGFLLRIQKGDSLRYRDAQLDDYSRLPRAEFPHHSLRLNLSARASAKSTLGTWGFGIWNDPFGLSLGFGGHPFRLPALPNAAWFFYASQESFLSFRGGFDTPPQLPANGFIAQTFRSPKFHPLLLLAGLAFPFSRKKTRSLLSRVINEDSAPISMDVTQWHSYSLQWSKTRVVWEVDNIPVFESPVSPHPPLGVIIWIDNQFASFTPDGKISAGILPNEDSWLEVRDIEIKSS